MPEAQPPAFGATANVISQPCRSWNHTYVVFPSVFQVRYAKPGGTQVGA